MHITLATWITILRLALIWPILALLDTFPLVVLFLLIIALVSDAVDGYVARRTQTITRLGTFLDHFADKVLVHVVLLWFVATQDLSAIAFGMFLVRDFLVLGFRHLATQKGVELPSMSLGKVKFVGQSALLVLLVLTLHWPWEWLSILTTVVLWAAVALAVISALQIVLAGWNVVFRE